MKIILIVLLVAALFADIGARFVDSGKRAIETHNAKISRY